MNNQSLRRQRFNLIFNYLNSWNSICSARLQDYSHRNDGRLATSTFARLSRISYAWGIDTVGWFHRVNNYFSDCIDRTIPVRFIQTLRESHEIDDYFQTLLDFNIPEHRLFVNDFKQRMLSEYLSWLLTNSPNDWMHFFSFQLNRKIDSFKGQQQRAQKESAWC